MQLHDRGGTRKLKTSNSLFSVEEVIHADDLERYYDGWNVLAENTEKGTIFQTYEWLTTWLKYFWPNKPIAFHFIMNATHPVALVPLLDDKKGDLWCPNTLVAPVNPHAMRVGVLCGEKAQPALTAFLDHVCGHHKRVRLAFKYNQKNQPGSQTLTQIAPQHGLTFMSQKKRQAPVVRIETDWETYLGSRSRHFRRELRRKNNKIKKAGSLECVVVSDPLKCAAAMADVLTIEQNSWKQDAGTSFTAEEGLAGFYGEFAMRAAEKNWLRLYLLYLDGQPLAHIYGVVFKNVYWAIKTSYDQHFRHLSPGVVIFAKALEDSFDQKLTLFDFLGEPDRWKSELENDTVTNTDMCIFAANDLKCSWCKLYQAGLKPWLNQHVPGIKRMKERVANTWVNAGKADGGKK